jgi:serine O-acetyltransferase
VAAVNDREWAARRQALARRIAGSYEEHGGLNRSGEKDLPSQSRIQELAEELLTLVFPGYYGGHVPARTDMEVYVAARLDALRLQLAAIIGQTLLFCYRVPCGCARLWTPEEENGEPGFTGVAERIAADYLEKLPEIRQTLQADVAAAYAGDPAAVNQDEIILCYPGTFAIAVYRLAHPLYEQGVPLIPRIMCEWAHGRTGVDIHPGAKIGPHFFIDHGTGVVIGETTTIGSHVKIYQGVTLGALSFQRNPDGTLAKGGKRHPTIEDDVTIYANATILGGSTVIGQGAVIGGGAWIIRSVPPRAVMLNQPSATEAVSG